MPASTSGGTARALLREEPVSVQAWPWRARARVRGPRPAYLEDEDDRDVLRERVVPNVQFPALDDEVGLALAFVRGARDGRAHLPFSVGLDDDTVLGQLLLDQDDLFDALHHKVAARVDRALAHAHNLLVRLASQDTVRRP